MVHRRQVLQGELPVRLQLEPQVGDGIPRWYPVPWVFQVGTEAQLQARDPLLKRFRDPPAKHRNFCKNRTFRESV